MWSPLIRRELTALHSATKPEQIMPVRMTGCRRVVMLACCYVDILTFRYRRYCDIDGEGYVRGCVGVFLIR